MVFNIKLSNGQVLKGMIISPGEKTRAVVLLVHGLGEHTRRYFHVANMFKDAGIGFAAVDLPGHGQSPGRRGHIRSYDDVREMIDIIINSSRQTFPGVPLYLYGHSLGGGIVLDYVIRNKPRISGALVSSPWLRLSFEPAKSKMLLASFIRYLLPGLVQSTGLTTNHLSHDELVIEQYENDPLVHDKCSVGLFYNAITTGRYALDHSAEVNIPVLLFHGSEDMITSPDSSREFASKNNITELKIFEGGYHELHNEPFRKEVFDYILNWIDRHK